MIIDNKSNLCFTYKQNQDSFSIIKRRYDHGFHEIIDHQSREGFNGQNYPTKNIFVTSDTNYIYIHAEDTFQIMNRVQVPIAKSDTDDCMEIITSKTSQDESLLAVLVGKNLIKAVEEMHQLFIYKLSDKEDDFALLHRIDLPEKHRFLSKAFAFN